MQSDKMESLKTEKKIEDIEMVKVENAAVHNSRHSIEKSEAEKKLVRKLDWLVPAVLCGAYFFAYLVSC